ncbi:GNAT family N-acetyltransferase [Ornithinimicrobium ciconiae]|uniref:GNAT family N-acetyltransferase n=1 Tax=Ornithinimicrobium ciconiae TaxID=2594265 RepID=A0A516GEC2_9MICO|nr:GNAT family N-acetyltransferase [Ornithinimicrobium ciconiae]QDO89866.1 GNAT family N-acetyltransferase [Ornithinimicrobium ciconiae]
MTDISVRVLEEENWSEYREARLRALKESPEAFVASAEEEESYDEARWRDRMQRSRRLLAEQDGALLGVVSVGSHKIEEPGVGELFGLWVEPARRGTGVARKLLEAAAAQARNDDLKQLIYWVGTDNGPAVAFASSFGFRPTDNRRPMQIHGVDDAEDAEELAMVLPLSNSAGVPTSL